jgi:hypothetical protein
MAFAEASSTDDIAKLVARCLANYGERKGVDMRLMVAEWHAALRFYSPQRLNSALSEHIRKSTWWPTIANLVDTLREEMAPPPRRPSFAPHLEPDRTPEEIAKRIKIIADAKRIWGDPTRREEPPAEAELPDFQPFVIKQSDASGHLVELLQKQRKRGW